MHRHISRSCGCALAFCVAFVTGCAVGPNFTQPQVQMPANWPAAQAQTGTAAEADLAKWWTTFGDPTLTALVERAIQSNLDLKLAGARMRQARAARSIAASDLGPAATTSGSYRRSKKGDEPAADQFQTGFDAVWELDVFGGARRSVEAAGADMQAAEENRRDVLVTLAAEVARNYIDLRTFQQRIAIAQQNLAAQQRSAEITRKRVEAGFANALDVYNATAQVATTTSQIPALQASAQQTIHSLSVLLGLEPAALADEMSPTAAIPAAPPAVPVGLPSDLLRRRPDIRAAEASVHSATARIGVATADLFPKLSLLGSIGWQSPDTGSLFSSVNRSWSAGPSVSWPIFQSGRILANIESQKALQEQSLITYRQTVLAALQEVENAFVASAREQERRVEIVKAVEANRKAAELASRLYTEGQTDFLSVLDAQRSLLSSQDALAQGSAAISTNLVALYKAVGGGWDEAQATAMGNGMAKK